MVKKFETSYSDMRVTVRQVPIAGKTVDIFEVRIVYYKDAAMTEVAACGRVALSRGNTWREALEDLDSRLEGISLAPVRILLDDIVG